MKCSQNSGLGPWTKKGLDLDLMFQFSTDADEAGAAASRIRGSRSGCRVAHCRVPFAASLRVDEHVGGVSSSGRCFLIPFTDIVAQLPAAGCISNRRGQVDPALCRLEPARARVGRGRTAREGRLNPSPRRVVLRLQRFLAVSSGCSGFQR